MTTNAARFGKRSRRSHIDGVVFRGGEALSGWLFNALRAAGLELHAISAATVPVALGWLALVLGKAHERRAAASTGAIDAIAAAPAYFGPVQPEPEVAFMRLVTFSDAAGMRIGVHGAASEIPTGTLSNPVA